MDETIFTSLTKTLWPAGADRDGQQVYWLMDGARDRNIAELIRSSGLDHSCLFSGELHPRLKAAAPYLVQLPPDSAQAEQLLRTGWGKAWGIFAMAPADATLAQLRLHFKKFLRVRTEEGKELAFRFYDPRVLNVYLPTCLPEEFAVFMGPVGSLYAELDEGQGVRRFAADAAGVWARDLGLTSSGT